MEPQPVTMDNHTSAKVNSKLVQDQILTEITEGRYIITPQPMTITSALGAIPKSNKAIRLIHDASRPAGGSLNSYVDDKMTVKFQTVKDAVSILKPGTFMAKVDLQAAYRSVALHPSQYKYTGLKWIFEGDSEPTYMYDSMLPFGATLSVGIFHRLSQAVCRMANRRNIKCIGYLDDFWITADTFEECQQALTTMIQLLRSLGFSISYKKVEGPAQVLTFLGIEIDSLNMQLRLPADKVDAYKEVLKSFLTRPRASRRQLEQLAGKLAWAAHVVQGGSTYLQRVLAMLRPLKKPHHKAKLSTEFYEDIQWWIAYIDHFNHKDIVLGPRPVIHVYTDSSNHAAGIVAHNDWLHINWQIDVPEVQDTHINVKETLAVAAAVYRWAPSWRGCQVIVHTDNMTAKAAFNKGRTNNSLIMPHIRNTFWLSQAYDFVITLQHIKGSNNIEADCVSRLTEPGQLQFWCSLLAEGCTYTDSHLANWLLGHCSQSSAAYIFANRLKLLPWLSTL